MGTNYVFNSCVNNTFLIEWSDNKDATFDLWPTYKQVDPPTFYPPKAANLL